VRSRRELAELVVAAWPALLKLCRLEVTYGVYLPRRRAVDGREKPVPTLGLGSRVRVCGYEYHHLYVDFDRRNVLKNILEFAGSHFADKFFVVRRTRKGYHLLVFYPFTAKEVDGYIARLKSMVDRKWLTLQRRRGFYVIRVAGKYREQDIETVHVHVPVDPETGEVLEKRLRYGLFWFTLVELLKETKPGTLARHLGVTGPAHREG